LVTCSTAITVSRPKEVEELFDITEVDVKVTQVAPGAQVSAEVAIKPIGDWWDYEGVAYIITFKLWWENVETGEKTFTRFYETPQINFSMIYPNPYKVPVSIEAPDVEGRWRLCGEVESYTPVPLPW